MSKLFDPLRIGPLELPNRFLRSATWEGMAEIDGSSTTGLDALMAKLAKGGVGLIITGHAYVSPEGQGSPRQLGIHDDAMIPGLKRMTGRTHEAGGLICCQLAHGGMRALEKVTGLRPLGPSGSDAYGNERSCRAMDAGDIEGVVRAFGLAAARAREAGFDAVQLHAAHGYLISQFLSGIFNLREDEYGGARENRERLLMEIYAAVREAAGPDFPVLVKINAHDYMFDKFKTVTPYDAEDMVSACSRLAEAGVDAVELSGGTPDSRRHVPIRMGMIKPEEEGYHRLGAKMYKKSGLTPPLALVGGIRSFERAEAFVDEGVCDLVSLSRPLIREPGLVKRWQEGDRAKAECMSDNLCFKPAVKGEGLYCVLRKKQAANAKKQ
ncbi:NADH:flavin oxidoreductase [Desulfocurvus sp. DL9XJH121]